MIQLLSCFCILQLWEDPIAKIKEAAVSIYGALSFAIYVIIWVRTQLQLQLQLVYIDIHSPALVESKSVRERRAECSCACIHMYTGRSDHRPIAGPYHVPLHGSGARYRALLPDLSLLSHPRTACRRTLHRSTPRSYGRQFTNDFNSNTLSLALSLLVDDR